MDEGEEQKGAVGRHGMAFCVNRSMFAHNALQYVASRAHNRQAGLFVTSAGTGSAVRLPGSAIDKPNIYTFGTLYDDMYQDLYRKDPKLYEANGLLSMLDRNRRIKPAPERWHDVRRVSDVVITCEERCFDSVCEDLLSRRSELSRAVHVINVDIKDNHEEAEMASHAILDLATRLDKANDVDEEIDGILEELQQRYPYPLLHTVAFY